MLINCNDTCHIPRACGCKNNINPRTYLTFYMHIFKEMCWNSCTSNFAAHHFIKILGNILPLRWNQLEWLLEFSYLAFPFRTSALKYTLDSAITRERIESALAAGDEIIALRFTNCNCASICLFHSTDDCIGCCEVAWQTNWIFTHVGRSIYFRSRCYRSDFNFLNFAIPYTSSNFAH
jgi:hypothetical protein